MRVEPETAGNLRQWLGRLSPKSIRLALAPAFAEGMAKKRSLLVALIVIHVAVLVSRASTFSLLGLEPIAGIIGLAYILVVPGFLILLVLNAPRIGVARRLLYSVGLSLALVMFLGAVLSIALPQFGATAPLSAPILLTAVLGITSVLTGLVAVLPYREFLRGLSLDWLDRKVAFAAVLPVVAVLGALSVNLIGSNLLLLMLLIMISILVLDVTISPPARHGTYPFVIGMIGLSLLLHTALITQQLVGWDIHTEYFFYSVTSQELAWDPSLRSNVNAMLSVTVLPTVFSAFSGLDGALLFKIIYPILFALVPVGLYEFLRRFFRREVAFLSAFFFMSFYVFFKEMTWLARQEIAELFLIMLLLLIVERQMRLTTRVLLSLVFSFSLVVSHYSIGFLMIFVFPATLVLGSILGRRARAQPRPFSWAFVALFAVFALAWYLFLAESSILANAAHVAQNVYLSIATDFFGSAGRDPSTLALASFPFFEMSLWRHLAWVLHGVVQLTILVGFLAILLAARRKTGRYDIRYLALSSSAMVLLVLSVLLPAFAPALNMSRIYHFSLLFLAPLVLIGGKSLLSRVAGRSKSAAFRRFIKANSMKIIAASLLVPYFLYNTGFVYAVTGDVPTSFALDDPIQDPKFSSQEFLAASWLGEKTIRGSVLVYGDYFGSLLLREWHPNGQIRVFIDTSDFVTPGACIFLRSANAVENTVLVRSEEGWRYVSLEDSEFQRVGLDPRGIVYTNGASEVRC